MKLDFKYRIIISVICIIVMYGEVKCTYSRKHYVFHIGKLITNNSVSLITVVLL